MRRPTQSRTASTDSDTIPQLTHQSSFESAQSPITPGHNTTKQSPTDIKTSSSVIAHDADSYPFPTPKSAPATTTTFPSSPKVPPKDLAFLSHDPFGQDDDVVPFDKNKPIKPSRSGSVKSISSMQSLKRGFSSLKRKLTRRSKSRPPPPERSVTEPVPESGDDVLMPPNRTQTFMMGPSMHGVRRVDTFQVSAMAF
ncbi:hypothetical protein H2198_008285 [Neophaeococcomyces mojaviensis]|uniref:Uncharacterized protein n=1 Tax=Neophaeococcomyces mojaviensis TaxID=3383035 RepID=A0ACC2ZXL2_9EURO|nr:hypothetical protein H2198_008285 [Knufia sp. JES_112]